MPAGACVSEGVGQTAVARVGVGGVGTGWQHTVTELVITGGGEAAGSAAGDH